MTNEQIKEQLSNKYVGVLAAHNGYTMDKPEQDLGVDYTIRRTYSYPINGRTRYTTDSRYIDIQLKATVDFPELRP